MQTRSDIKPLFLVVEQLRKANWNVTLGDLHSNDLIHKMVLWFDSWEAYVSCQHRKRILSSWLKKFIILIEQQVKRLLACGFCLFVVQYLDIYTAFLPVQYLLYLDGYAGQWQVVYHCHHGKGEWYPETCP